MRWNVRPVGSRSSARSVGWREAARTPGSTPARRSLWLGSRKHAGTRRALHQLGVVHAHADPPDVDQATTHYRQALALAEADYDSPWKEILDGYFPAFMAFFFPAAAAEINWIRSG